MKDSFSSKQKILSNRRFEAEPEPEARQNIIRQQKLQPGSTRRCAAGGQTTGLGKRAVDSHVQTRSVDRSLLRGARGNRGSPVNDRVGSMKNLEDYLPRRAGRTTPVKISESPILSPDTLDALRKAETLVKEAQKTILEASYDVASSSEHEQSTQSAGQKEAEDEDVIYIRDIVATRFYEANESARIFTRPSTRSLAERVCRPISRQRRTRRVRERSGKICSEESTTSRPTSVQLSSANVPRNRKIYSDQFHEEFKKTLSPQNTVSGEEIPTRIPKDTNKFPSPWKIDNRNVANSLGVQQGPRIDIRNELTIMNVEKVDISPQPCSLLPAQQNFKTYEFRHESCVEEIVDDTKNPNDEARSIQPGIGDDTDARDSPEAYEKSRDPIRKSRGSVAASQQQRSWSDLVDNKSGRSIPPELFKGHVNNVLTRIENRSGHVPEENEENKGNEKNIENNEDRDECFMDFLRRSRNLEKNDKNESFKQKVFRSLDNDDKIHIFDRAIEQFLNEFKYEERDKAQTKFSSSLKPSQDICLPEKEVDENLVEDASRETDHSFQEEFHGGDYFEEEWDPEEINLQPPNFEDLEKNLRKFDSTMRKVLRDTKNLAVLMSEYSDGTVMATRPGLINQDNSYNPCLFYSVATNDISSSLELTNIHHLSKKASDNHDDRAVQDKIESRKELIDSRCYSDTKGEVEKKLPMEREASERLDHHPRFSTPLNNDLKIGRPCGSNADCKSNEFTRFLIGIQRPRGIHESKEGHSSVNVDLARTENRSDDKIVLNRNEFLPAVYTATRNDLEFQKKIVLDEINKKCNFNSLFDKDRLIRAENEEKTHETQTIPNYSIEETEGCSEVRNSGMRSLIQDSAIGRATDDSAKISINTKLIEEHNTKQDSIKSKQSTIIKNVQTSQIKSLSCKNIQSMRTKTLNIKENPVKSAQAVKESVKKLSTALQAEIVDVTKTSDNENEYSIKDKETMSNKNRLAGSPGSSLKDRTSFDISTVYSEDFEEPVVSAEKLEAQEKSDSPKTAELKSMSKQEEVEENKKSDSKNAVTSSLQSTNTGKLSHEKSKGEIQYLEKSVSISKLSNKIEEIEKVDSDGSRLIELVAEENGTVECNSEIKELNEILPEMTEKSCRDGSRTDSTSVSTRLSGTSSIARELRQENIKLPNELNDELNLGHFELEMKLIASSCIKCKGDSGKCSSKANTCYVVGEPNDVLEKSSSISTVDTFINDSLENDKNSELCISEEVIKTLESDNRNETITESNEEHNIKLCQAENDFENEWKNVSQVEEAQQELEELERCESPKNSGISNKNINELRYKSPDEFCFSAGQIDLASRANFEEFTNFESSVAFHSTPKHPLYPSESSNSYYTENAKNLSKYFSHKFDRKHNSTLHHSKDDLEEVNEVTKMPRIDNTDKEMNKTRETLGSDHEEVTNFASSIMIDFIPKHPIKNSRCVSEEFFSFVSNPIPNDDHANVAADTCSENYSEGELYLPSSCSYSLGEIRISERGSYGTVGTMIPSSARNTDGMRIYFSKKKFTRNTSDNTLKTENSPAQSPGEVQETDVESTRSFRALSSNGEQHMS